MNWNDYRYFLAVARTGKLSAAGRQLNVDHATVSRRVHALEEELGAKLFDRSPSGYGLTEVGTELVPIAEGIERQAVLAYGTIGNQRTEPSGPVRIGVPDGVATYVVVEAAQKLCEKYPKIEVQLVAIPQKFSLSKREADFVIAVSQPETGRLKVQKICDYKLHLYGSKDYLANNPPVHEIADLKKLRGVGYVSDMIYDKQLDYIPLVDRELHPHLTSTSVHVQLQAVLNGAGICIVHDFMADQHDNLERVLPNDVSFTRAFWFVVHEDYARIERIRICADLIIDHMRKALRG